MKFDEEFLQRFWDRVDKKGKDECWEWLGCLDIGGYGHISYKGKNLFSHRVAYIIANGQIPSGMRACHSCDNRKCCNPNHLWIGTDDDNRHDMIKKNRQHRPIGEKNVKSKVTGEDVYAIRLAYYEGRNTQMELAKIYNLSKTETYRIINNLQWKNVPSFDNPPRKRNMAKNDIETIKMIKKYLDEGIFMQKEIAKLCDVPQQMVSHIKNGRIWKEME